MSYPRRGKKRKCGHDSGSSVSSEVEARRERSCKQSADSRDGGQYR